MIGLGPRFGAHLRFWRESNKLTQLQMSEKIGVNRVTLAKWESGEAGSATLETVERALLAIHPAEDLDQVLSPAWREVIRRVGDLDDTQVSAAVTGIKAALAAVQESKLNPSGDPVDPSLDKDAETFLDAGKPVHKPRKKG